MVAGSPVTYFSEAFSLVSRVSTLVDELHLLEDGGLAGFTGTEQQHLDLVPKVHLVPLQLVLDLLVPLLALLGL